MTSTPYAAPTALPRTLQILQHGIAEGLHTGAQLFVSINGRPIVETAVGMMAGDTPMSADALTLWMSAGKPLTAALILRLLERGLLDLDRPVSEVLLPMATLGKQHVTPRHLLTHTAGFRGPLNNFTPGTFDDVLEKVYALKQEPGWLAGAKAGYHIGSSWFVLGALAERVLRRPYSAALRDEVLRPAGMTHTSVGLTPEQAHREAARIAPVYQTGTPPGQPAAAPAPRLAPFGNAGDAITTPRPGANARGPIRELGRFYEVMLGVANTSRGESGDNGPDSLSSSVDRPADAPPDRNRSTGARSASASSASDPREASADSTQTPAADPGYPLLSPESVREMTRRQREGMFDETFKCVIDWGLGFMIDSKRYRRPGDPPVPYGYGRHASDATFGHSGNQTSCAFADPSHQLVVAWVCNGMPGEIRHQVRQHSINTLIYEELGLAV